MKGKKIVGKNWKKIKSGVNMEFLEIWIQTIWKKLE